MQQTPVLAASGARRGEILALEWSDIDLDQATISITKAISIVKGVRAVDQTKNSKARVVPIDAQTVAGLRTHLLRHSYRRYHYPTRNIFCLLPQSHAFHHSFQLYLFLS